MPGCIMVVVFFGLIKTSTSVLNAAGCYIVHDMTDTFDRKMVQNRTENSRENGMHRGNHCTMIWLWYICNRLRIGKDAFKIAEFLEWHQRQNGT